MIILSTHSPYMEYTLFNLDNYFNKVQIEDNWKDLGKVTFYHHTLHELSNALNLAEFEIQKILEPQPLLEMQEADPQLYDKLTKSPWFLFVKAIKNN